MNTRLQVEHPVTEAVTGIDLVAWQLRVAAGEGLPCGQDEIQLKGHAFEARLYAEDVPAGFLPATGRLSHLRFPASARIGSGIQQGDEISPWYDPMIAKLTTHGPDRTVALQRLRSALESCEVAGTVTNLGFLRRLVRDPAFEAGDVDTGLIARNGKVLTTDPAPTPTDIAVAAATAAGLPEDAFAGFTLWDPLNWVISLAQGDQVYDVRLKMLGPDACEATCNGLQTRLSKKGEGWGLPSAIHNGQITVFGPAVQTFAVVDPLDRTAALVGGDTVLAPMPGLVRSVTAQVGQSVAAGDRLLVLEAMKMEHVLRAPRDGVIAEVCVAPDAQVKAQMPLVHLEPE